LGNDINNDKPDNYYEPDGIGQQLSKVNPKKLEAPANNIVRTGRPGLLPFLLASKVA
jgi:hypothetical protein